MKVMAVMGVLALSAVVALAQSTKPVAGAPAHQAASSAKAAPREPALSGTIASYDASASTLTVKTSSGDQTVQVASHTRIHEGSKSLKVSALGGLSGREAKVRYRESNGKMIAEWITVAPAAAK
jgi:phage baseplate assembly protein gpV